MAVSKRASSANATGVAYQVVIEGTGTSTNVVVADTLPGSMANRWSSSGRIVLFDPSVFSFSAVSNKGTVLDQTVVFDSNDPESVFTYTIPKIQDGEVVTLTFRARADATRYVSSTNGTGRTTSTVTVTAPNDGDPSNNTATAEHTGTVSSGWPDRKDYRGTTTSDEGIKTIYWEIKADWPQGYGDYRGVEIYDKLTDGRYICSECGHAEMPIP